MHRRSTPKRRSINTPTMRTSTRGRPIIKTLPDPIHDTLENMAISVLNTPPKNDQVWEYLKRGK